MQATEENEHFQLLERIKALEQDRADLQMANEDLRKVRKHQHTRHTLCELACAIDGLCRGLGTAG